MSRLDTSFIKIVDTNAAFAAEVLGERGALVVVDVHAAAWGPCLPMQKYLYDLLCDLGDEHKNLKVVQAAADGISALREYRDTSKPHFLFYLDGNLKASVKSPQLPAIRAHAFKLAPSA